MKKLFMLFSILIILSLVIIVFNYAPFNTTNGEIDIGQNQSYRTTSSKHSFDAERVNDVDTLLISKSFNLSTEQTVEKQDNVEIRTDSGRYHGQADSNFIEIKISGVPDEKATKVYMLSDEVKANFEQVRLKKDESIKFKYFQNENEQLVITEIEKI